MRGEYLPKAAERAARRVEKRGSVARSSPVVGKEDEPGGRVGVRLPGRLLGLPVSTVLCFYIETWVHCYCLILREIKTLVRLGRC